MDKTFAANDALCETNVQFIVVVEVGKLLATVEEAREPVISPRQCTIFHSELLKSSN
jgi:hypothetical protein